MHEPVFIKLGLDTMASEPTAVACLQIPLISNTNTTASQIVAAITLILFESLNRL
jgi:hypothetical protein